MTTVATPVPTAVAVSARPSLHAVTGLTWAVAAAACVELAPSPLYVALVVALAAVVVEAHAADSPFRRAFPALIVLGVAFSLVRVVLTALTTHGTGTVLFTLPQADLPTLLGGFTVGGTVELPVVLQSLAEGFALVGVMAVFGAFNAVVSHAELLQRLPRAFYALGVAASVALAFVPSTILALRDVRDADRSRTGGVVRRRGRLRRQAVPVLELGLERAISLSESMDARGFGRAPASAYDVGATICGLGGLFALGGAFIALVGRTRPAAALLGTVGAALIVAAVACGSRATGRTRYRPRRLTGRDAAAIACSVTAPLALGLLAWLGDGSLTWTASPLRWPSFHLAPTLALLLLAGPLLVPTGER